MQEHLYLSSPPLLQNSQLYSFSENKFHFLLGSKISKTIYSSSNTDISYIFNYSSLSNLNNGNYNLYSNVLQLSHYYFTI